MFDQYPLASTLEPQGIEGLCHVGGIREECCGAVSLGDPGALYIDAYYGFLL